MSVLYFAETDEKFQDRLKQELLSIFQPGESIAVKLHMGELNNPNHLKPEFVRTVVDVLKKIGVKPFLFDSPVMYRGNRHTVEGYEKQNKEMGFTEEVIGCPVVISNESLEVKGKFLSYEPCKALADADGVLVLTHFKGHMASGIGGSIKNLGMGGLSRESKTATHTKSRPVQDGKCILCRKCLEVCPGKCITYSEGGPVFDFNRCYGCSKCIQNCPEKCLKPEVAEMDELIADGANTALGTYKKAYFVNVLRGISDYCDCHNGPVKRLVPDIGFLMGRDIVAIDNASLDTVNKKAGRLVFNERWNKESDKQIKVAAGLDMGNLEYEIKDA